MNIEFDFSDYRVIVTGGSRGIGKGIAEAFLKSGAKVSICARNAAALEQTRHELANFGAVHAESSDLSDRESVRRYVAHAAEAMGGIDILVNNVSSIPRGDGEAVWRDLVEVDLVGMTRMIDAALPWLEKSSDASIINIGSVTAYRVSKSAPAYAAIKAAIRSYTASQGLLMLEKGIRVNSVAPGATTAPDHFWEERRQSGDPRYVEAVSRQPTGRLGLPEDIAGVVQFLASDAGRWVIGQTILADGGLLANGG